MHFWIVDFFDIYLLLPTVWKEIAGGGHNISFVRDQRFVATAIIIWNDHSSSNERFGETNE